MRRFYKSVTTAPQDGGIGVFLDGRPLRTPAKAPLVLASAALAEGVAAEWRAQAATIEPRQMPLTQMVSTAIDRVRRERPLVLDEIIAYAATDLLCYRAETPLALAERQDRAWQPWLDWLGRRYDVCLLPTVGIVAREQNPACLARLRQAVASQDDFVLTATHLLTTALGSMVLALAVVEGALDADTAFAASVLDESFQNEQWGDDAEAAKRRENLLADVRSYARFLKLLHKPA